MRLLAHLLAGLAILLGPGGTRAVLAENMLLKRKREARCSATRNRATLAAVSSGWAAGL